MCYEYEWFHWKSKTEKAERNEQPKVVTERTPPVKQPVQPAPAMRKPEKVDSELEPV